MKTILVVDDEEKFAMSRGTGGRQHAGNETLMYFFHQIFMINPEEDGMMNSQLILSLNLNLNLRAIIAAAG